MKKILVLLTAFLFTLSMQAQAFEINNIFSFLNPAISQKVTVSDCTKMISDIKAQSESADNEIKTSFLDIVSKLSATKEANTVKSKINNIFSKTSETSAEKRAEMSSLMADYIAALANNKDGAVSKIQSLTDTQKSELINDIINMQSCAKKYIEITKKSISAMSAIKKASATAVEATEMISEINNTVGNVKTAANTMINIQSQIKSFAKLAGLSIL